MNTLKKRKTLPFDITFQDVEEVYPKDGLCPVFKIHLVPKDKKYTPTIDRIDSSLGYVKGNIQILSMLANKMKSDSTREELLLFSKGILKLYGENP